MTKVITPFTYELDIREECTIQNLDHTSYDIFMLKSRLLPFIQEYMGKNYTVNFDYDTKENKGVGIIYPVLGSKKIKLPQSLKDLLETKMHEVLSYNFDHCLIFNSIQELTDREGKQIPRKWIEQIIRYVNVIPQKYKPSVHEYNIYADLSNFRDFRQIYEELHQDIVEQIRSYYHKGLLTDAESIQESWNLEKFNLNLEGKYPLPCLFKPNWHNVRFSKYPVDFLYERIAGSKFIKLEIGINNVIRFFISKHLNALNVAHYYQDRFIFIKTDNYNFTQTISNDIFNLCATATGKTLILACERLSWVKIYNFLAEGENVTNYLRKDIFPQLVFSQLIPENNDLDFFVNQYQRRSRRLLLYIKNNYKTDNIHDMIERKDFKFEIKKDINNK